MSLKSALLFDDSLTCRTLLADIISKKDFKVRSFSNPSLILSRHDEAECHMDGPCVDVILTDNQMPGMSGLEYLEQLEKKGCKIPNHRKAIISGKWSQEQLSRAEQLGCRIFHKTGPIEDIFAWLDE